MSSNNTLLAFIWGRTTSTTPVYIQDWLNLTASFDGALSFNSTTGDISVITPFSAKLSIFGKAATTGSAATNACYSLYHNGEVIAQGTIGSNGRSQNPVTVALARNDILRMSIYADRTGTVAPSCGLAIEVQPTQS